MNRILSDDEVDALLRGLSGLDDENIKEENEQLKEFKLPNISEIDVLLNALNDYGTDEIPHENTNSEDNKELKEFKSPLSQEDVDNILQKFGIEPPDTPEEKKQRLEQFHESIVSFIHKIFGNKLDPSFWNKK